MGLDLPTGNALIGQGTTIQPSLRADYLRLVEPEIPSTRPGTLGRIGSTLLDLPWLVWIGFDAVLVFVGVWLGYRSCVWVPGGTWLTLGWGNMCLIQCTAFLLSALVFGLYEQQTLLRRSRILARSVLSIAGALILTALAIQFVMYELLSRRALIVSGVFYLALGPTVRLLACWCISCHSRKYLIVGTDRKSRISLAGPEATQSDALSRRYRLVGYLAMDAIEIGREIDGAPVLGTIDDIERICLEYGVNEIVVGPGPTRNGLVLDRMLGCLKLGCRVTNLSTFYEQVMSEVPVAHLEPNWFLFADLKHYREAQLILKRTFDLAGSALGLLVALPIWLLIALLIKLDSPGPVFYSQRRVGLNGRIFRLHKFRTMHVGAERNGHTWAAINDPRVTAVGWYLRKTRLDELPQLWNILCGHMSLVGPRPERPEFVEELAKKIRFYNERHLIKPGLTGWAQINYHYGASIDDSRRKLQLDLWYMKHMSFELDLVILLRTLGTVFLGSR